VQRAGLVAQQAAVEASVEGDDVGHEAGNRRVRGAQPRELRRAQQRRHRHVEAHHCQRPVRGEDQARRLGIVVDVGLGDGRGASGAFSDCGKITRTDALVVGGRRLAAGLGGGALTARPAPRTHGLIGGES